MALGNTYNNNQQNEKRRPTVNSAFSFANPVSTVDPSRLSISFWNRMIKLTISPRVNTGNEEEIVWEKKQNISAHLTHFKAAMLANEIRAFINDPEANNGNGVLSNQTLITISNGKEFGANGIFLVIRKINLSEDQANMETVSSYSYEFNSAFHHSIRDYNEGSATFNKEFDDYAKLELEQLLIALDNYVNAITNAVAYTVVDQLDYRMNKTDEMLKNCAASLGVDTSNTYSSNSNRRISGGSKSNNSSFGQSGEQTRRMSLEEADDELLN